MGSIVVVGVWFLASIFGLAVAGWLATALLHGRRRSLTVVLAALSGLLTLAGAADLVNAHYSYLPRVDDVIGVRSWPTAPTRVVSEPAPAPHRSGSVVSLPVPGPRSGFGAHAALVYLPPEYFIQPGARFPVVYLLHGSPGAPVDWFRANRAAAIGSRLARAGRPAILVAPRLSHDWLDDSECVERPTEHIETYLVDDVIPTIDRSLRTRADRDDRVFAGMSAGGFCALNLGLRHRDLVATIIAMSGLDRPTHTGGMATLFGRRPDLAAVVAANSPVGYANDLSATPPTRVWLDCGRADRESIGDTRAMATLLGARGLDVVLRLRGGGHTYAVWRPALADSLSWAVPSTPPPPVPLAEPVPVPPART